jgi:hypothetical protein
MASYELTPDQEILRARIRFALRRATGFVFDIDAMLRKPELRLRRIGLWRGVESRELSSLLDQLETEFQSDFDEHHEADAKASATRQGRLDNHAR